MSFLQSRPLVALIVLYLSGCGGGGSSVPECVPKAVKVQYFGDSTAVGYDGKTGEIADPSPIQLLQAEMDARFGVGAVTTELRAVAGTDTSMLLAGNDWLNLPWPQSVDADILIMNHGINDQFHDTPYEANLRQLAVAPAQILWETPNPNPALDMTPWVETMKTVAHDFGIPIADTFTYVNSIPNWQDEFYGAHPDAAMYVLIVQNALAPALIPMVAKLRCD